VAAACVVASLRRCDGAAAMAGRVNGLLYSDGATGSMVTLFCNNGARRYQDFFFFFFLLGSFNTREKENDKLPYAQERKRKREPKKERKK
jgi:hypothetical protein